MAIVRVEQFYPFPAELLRHDAGRYRKAKEWVWVQEESQNMGGWTFVEPRLRALGFPVDTSAGTPTAARPPDRTRSTSANRESWSKPPSPVPPPRASGTRHLPATPYRACLG